MEDYARLEVQFCVAGPFNMEYRLRRADGFSVGSMTVELRLSSEGEFLGFIGSCIDIRIVRKPRSLRRAHEVSQLNQPMRKTYLREEIKLAHNEEIIGQITPLSTYCLRSSRSVKPIPVLILGETGTEKSWLLAPSTIRACAKDRPLVK